MSITNGSTILASDLASLVSASLALVQADNALLPGGWLERLSFPNLVTGTSAERRKAVIVSPFDAYLEALAVEAVDHTAASTMTVNVFGDGALQNWPVAPPVGSLNPFIQFVGTVGAGQTKGPRLLRDNTKTHAASGAVGTRALTPFPKGSTIIVQPSSTSVATPSQTYITLVLREFFARE